MLDRKEIRVLIVDDHTVMREGLKRIMEGYPDLVITGEAGTGEEAISKVAENDYDMVIMDVSMPGRGGIDALREVKRMKPNIPVIILSMYPEDQYAVRAFRAGASAYLVKERSPEDLVNAIRKVVDGGTHMTHSMARRVAACLGDPKWPSPHEKLSDREDMVLRKLASGESLSDIAEELELSVKTVGTYKRRIYQKMKMNNISELIRYCIENGLE